MNPDDVTPERIFALLSVYQQTAALRGAIELDLFTGVGRGATSVKALAAHCQATERGVRVLSDCLVVMGLLTKEGQQYGLSPEASRFLDRASPACFADVAKFMGSDTITGAFRDIAETVRRGGTVLGEEGTIAADHPVWVNFALHMVPMIGPIADQVASVVEVKGPAPRTILDIAAGHGLFGISMARRFKEAELVALDWEGVLQVARKNAEEAGLSSRFRTIAGSAFDVDLDTGYDLVLLPNFLHHFGRAECITLLKRIHGAMVPGGRVVIVEFIPDDNRVSPEDPALFALVMLATTPRGDAYTFAEFEGMLSECGFSRHQRHELDGFPQRVVVSVKAD